MCVVRLIEYNTFKNEIVLLLQNIATVTMCKNRDISIKNPFEFFHSAEMVVG